MSTPMASPAQPATATKRGKRRWLMHGIEKEGLTETGREVLTEMERLGIVVDIAHASEFAVITQELRDRGHSTRDVAAIMGGNTLRVLREVLPR